MYDTVSVQYMCTQNTNPHPSSLIPHPSVFCFLYYTVVFLLINQCQRVNTEKEQQLDRFCTAWEDLKWERDTFAKEINRRDCCGEGVIDEKFARKLRKKCWGSKH